MTKEDRDEWILRIVIGVASLGLAYYGRNGAIVVLMGQDPGTLLGGIANSAILLFLGGWPILAISIYATNLIRNQLGHVAARNNSRLIGYDHLKQRTYFLVDDQGELYLVSREREKGVLALDDTSNKVKVLRSFVAPSFAEAMRLFQAECEQDNESEDDDDESDLPPRKYPFLDV
jgi:hypothetical protein